MLKIQKPQNERTSKEASQFFGLIGMAHTVDEAIVLVRLHPGLDAVKGECGEGRQYTGSTGSDFSSVAFDEPLLFVRHEGLLLYCCCCCWSVSSLLFRSHGISCRPTMVVALLSLTSAGALRRHGRRLKLGTILLEGCEFSWHAFWQSEGPGGSRL